ncbi:MAG: hypothetical protein LBB59_09055 [Campylobacteraceae bacterium]|jgi:hypothetical protein|nr:hypothetical protein [Campylobacteraceae bacterium]
MRNKTARLPLNKECKTDSGGLLTDKTAYYDESPECDILKLIKVEK